MIFDLENPKSEILNPKSEILNLKLKDGERQKIQSLPVF